MAEGESNLSVQLFVELKERFPQASELRLQNMIKQFSNNREKCLEALNKEYSGMSSSSHPNNNHHHHQMSNSWINYNIDSSASYSSNANKPWSPCKNPNISEIKPNLNPDFRPFIKTSSDSSTIPNIKCQSSPPVMQIAVQHITTSKPDSPNTHMFCKSPSNCSSSSSSPNNGNQWNWPKSHEVLITPTSTASAQHFAKANLFIDTPNQNVTNHQTVLNPSSGGTCVISSNPRLQPSMVRPSRLITIHSPHSDPQSASLYSPQPGYSGHGVPDTYSHLPTSPNPPSRRSDVNSGFSSQQLCIPVQVQSTTSLPSTVHHVSSTTYQTTPLPQQNIGSSTTSAIIHYPAIQMNNSSGQPGNSTSSETMKNRTASQMPILPTFTSSGDGVQMPRPRNGSLQEDSDYTNALITHQRLRYDKLNKDYEFLLDQYKELKEEIEKLARDKKRCYSKRSFPTELDVLELRHSIESLRLEIDTMTMELDTHNNGLTPIGILDPLEQQHFYKNMNTGQSGSIFATPQSPQSRNNPPPRPPRYKPESHPVPPSIPDNELVEDTWNCSECTYMNHQALDKCEMCEFPRKHKAN